MIKKIIPVLAFMISISPICAQSENKEITITAIGSGKTLEDARQSALRSAIEQAFGVFISSKTEILNDKLIADQIASVSSGNIKSFDILNQEHFPDGRWGVTLKAVLSLDKLTSFVQSKGITIEIKGGMFALNIKQQLLNEQGERQAINDMISLLHESLQISFDYSIKSGEPVSDVENGDYWNIPLTVYAHGNNNIDFSANYIIKTLEALSLSDTDAETYTSLKKKIYSVNVKHLKKSYTFNLRNQTSINAIRSLCSNWEFYTRLFQVESGMDEISWQGEGKIYKFSDIDQKNSNNENSIKILFPNAGQLAGTFTWNDRKSLSQIEQLTGYKVKPTGVVSSFKNGGYVVSEKDGHGLVVAVYDLGKLSWHDAKNACEILVMNGFSDWYLPSIEEWLLISNELNDKRLGGFIKNHGNWGGASYWTSTEYNSQRVRSFSFLDSFSAIDSNHDKNSINYVRAVRAF